MEKFKLWDMAINLFCQNVENLTTEAKSLIKDLKGTFPEVFFGRCNKMTAKFELNNDIQPVFTKRKKKCALHLFTKNK